jgi:hypothetical protein
MVQSTITNAPAGTPVEAGHQIPHVEIRPPEPAECIYVYLASGEIVEVPAITGLSLSGTEIALHRDGAVVVEYPRSGVYLVSRKLISPPTPF